MRFFRSPRAVMALVVIGIAAGWKPIELKAAPAPVAACCAADRGAARCCTATCTATCCTAACTAACCAIPAKASTITLACCATPVTTPTNASACCRAPTKPSANAAAFRGAGAVKASLLAPACGGAPVRKALASSPVQLVPIEGSLQPVIEQFNAHKDKPRVVVMLSPTCGGCVHAANAIFAEVLQAHPDEDLRVLVIWEPMLGSDNEAAARESATIFDDPRVVQFWDAERLSGITYSTEVYPQRMRQIAEAMPADHFMKGRFQNMKDVPPQNVPMWDFAVFYPPGVQWTDTPPASSAFIRQLAIYMTPQGTSATMLTDDFTQAPVESDWYDEVRREMAALLGTKPVPGTDAAPRARRSPPAGAVLASAPVARRVTDYPDSPTGRAAQALVELTWTTGQDALREFVESKLSPGSRDRNSEATLLDAFGQIRDHVTEAELQSAKRTGPLSAELVLVSERNGTQITLTVDLEPDPPHRIDHLRSEAGAGANAAGPLCAPPPDAGDVNALGVATTAPTSDIATTMKLAHRIRTEGRVVTEIEPDGPADRAGIEQGDVLLQLADNRLYSADDITDFLAITANGEPIDVLVRRAGSTDDEQIRITPAPRPQTDPGRAGIDWQYAGLAQLDEALNRARASGKPVLVGLAGSDTCCPFTRFEVDSISAIVDDPQVVEGSQDFVTIIIRRPHAYWFLELGREEEPMSVSATPAGVVIDGGDLLPIPSFFFIDPDQNVLGNIALAQPDALPKTLELMENLR